MYEALLLNGVKSNIINKTRYTFPIGKDSLIAELDIYEKDLEDLNIIKVKFAYLEQAKVFEPLKWFGEEITNNNIYKTQYLAFRDKDDYFSLILHRKKILK